LPAVRLHGFFTLKWRNEKARQQKNLGGTGATKEMSDKSLILLLYIAPENIYIYGGKVGASWGRFKNAHHYMRVCEVKVVETRTSIDFQKMDNLIAIARRRQRRKWRGALPALSGTQRG
jgi:hypothetical protein